MSLKITEKEIVSPADIDTVVGVKDDALVRFTIESMLSTGAHLKKQTVVMSNDDLLAAVSIEGADGGAFGVIELVAAAEGKVRIPVFIAANLQPWAADYTLDGFATISFAFLGMPVPPSSDYDYDELLADSDGWYANSEALFLAVGRPQMAFIGPPEFFYNFDEWSAPNGIDGQGFQEGDPQGMSNKPIQAVIYNGSFPNPITGGDSANVLTWTVYYVDIDVPVEP